MRDLRRVHPPDKEVLRGINISMYPGAKIGVLGLNGSGKSTLLRIIAGEDDGYQRRVPGHARLHRSATCPRSRSSTPSKDVLGNVTDGVAHTKGLLDRFEEVCNAMGEPDADFDKLLAEQSELQDQIDAVNGWDLDRQLEIAMDALRLPPADADVDDAVAAVSGAASRCAGCCSSKPDLLLLDEPTNHLDAESVAWLERHLQEYHGTVVAVTHDRYFLDNVAGWILELDRGHGIPWEGNYSSWLEQKDAAARAGGEGRRDAPAHARSASSSGSAWRRAPARPRARRASTRTTSSSPKPRRPSSAPGQAADLDPARAAPRRPGRRGRAPHARATATGCSSTTSSFSLPPRRHRRRHRCRTARARPRCSACSSARSSPTAARSRSARPSSSRTSTSRASRSTPTKTVYEEITGGVDHLKVGDREVHGRAYVAGFNFKGSDQQKRVGDLSGGERNRLHLAKALLMGGNVLLLDEPTNDLDVDTLRALEEALLEFPGCAVVISHDRWFLDRIATHVLAFEGDSEVRGSRATSPTTRADRHKRLGARRRPAPPHQVQAADALGDALP